MKYVRGDKKSLTARLLEHFSTLSTAPAVTYPLPEEHLGLPSLQVSALSITVLSPSRAYVMPVPNRSVEEG